MTITANDPRLTAYAFGECDDQERAAVEAAIAANPELARVLDDLRATGKLLNKGLSIEQAPGLQDAQRRSIDQALRKRVRRPIRLTYLVASVASAAAVLTLSMNTQMVKAREHSAPAFKLGIGDEQTNIEKPEPVIVTDKSESVNQFELVDGESQVTEATKEVFAQSTTKLKTENKPEAVEDLQEIVRRVETPAPVVVLAQSGKPATPAPQYRLANKSADQKVDDGFYAFSLEKRGELSPQANDKPTQGRYLDREIMPLAQEPYSSEAYDHPADNLFQYVAQAPLSTFSIDVDSASYANMRRFLNQNQLPPPEAVRIEEMINYFSYHYKQPTDSKPFAVDVEVASCPWDQSHRLARVGLKGKEIAQDARPVSNLVFLLDVSGSMNDANKLPLVKSALTMLVERLSENDRVSMVVYAGASGLVLQPTTGDHKRDIIAALDKLQAGGSTNGGAGIQLAYDTARQHFIQGGVNRVILCTDGDFNVGIVNQGDLVSLIEREAKGGTFLSVLGFGMGNLKDSTMEKLADKGNGNYAYIDNLLEARKVLVEQMNGTLVTIAKDVKIQVEFNPAQVSSYRLVGYENRMLAKEDFNDDRKDAGEIGAGHTVTALYEIVPAGMETPHVDNLKYQKPEPQVIKHAGPDSNELLTVKLRYKMPEAETSQLMEIPVIDDKKSDSAASSDFRWAAAVASFGMVLRHSPYAGSSTIDSVLALAQQNVGEDASSYRKEFITLVGKARELTVPQENWREGVIIPND